MLEKMRYSTKEKYHIWWKYNTVWYRKIGENDEDRLTDDIEVMKLVKLSSKSDRDIIDKESDEGSCIDRVDDKKYDERY